MAAAHDIRVSTAHADVDVDVVYGFLSQSYWAKGMPRATLERALVGSLCFSLLEGPRQIGFARAVTDRATFAYLADVFVLPSHQGRGLARVLMDAVTSHPDLQGLRRSVLVTRDAHGLYARYGWKPLANVGGYMELWDPDVYTRGAGSG